MSGTRARWQLEMPLAVACTEKRPTRGIEAIDPHAIGAEVGHERPFLAPRIEADLVWMAALLSIPQRGVGCGQRVMPMPDSVYFAIICPSVSFVWTWCMVLNHSHAAVCG